MLQDSKSIPSFKIHEEYMSKRVIDLNDQVNEILDMQPLLRRRAHYISLCKKNGCSLEETTKRVMKEFPELYTQFLSVYEKLKNTKTTTFNNGESAAKIGQIKQQPIRPLTSIVSKGSIESKAVDLCCGTGIKSALIFKNSDSLMVDLNDARIDSKLDSGKSPLDFKFTTVNSVEELDEFDRPEFKWALAINVEHFRKKNFDFTKTSLFKSRQEMAKHLHEDVFIDVASNGNLYKQRIIHAKDNELVSDNHIFTYAFSKYNMHFTSVSHGSHDPNINAVYGLRPGKVEFLVNCKKFYEKIDGEVCIFVYNSKYSFIKFRDPRKAIIYLDRPPNSHASLRFQMELKGLTFYLLNILEFDGFTGLFSQAAVSELIRSNDFTINGVKVNEQEFVTDLNSVPKKWEGVVIKKGLPQLESYYKRDYTVDVNKTCLYLKDFGFHTPEHDGIKEYAILGNQLKYVRDRDDKSTPTKRTEFSKLIKAHRIY